VVQVIPAWPPNQPHRVDIAKLLVHRRGRRRGPAAALMRAAEEATRQMGRTLMVLDTVTDSPAEALYDRLGWIRAGVIPDYALMPDGEPCPATFFYKEPGR
jgi:GNAT superfamily N-acetyltransferase